MLALNIDLAADEVRNFLPDAIQLVGPVPVGDEPVGLLRSAEQLLRRVATPGAWIEPHCLEARVADLVWGANTGVGCWPAHCRGAAGRQRRLARETLLDTTLEHAPAMVRSWNQLVESAANLWAVLPSTPDRTFGSDSMQRLRVVGAAIGRSVTAGHWPGQRTTDV